MGRSRLSHALITSVFGDGPRSRVRLAFTRRGLSPLTIEMSPGEATVLGEALNDPRINPTRITFETCEQITDSVEVAAKSMNDQSNCWTTISQDQRRWIDEKIAELGLRHASPSEMLYLIWRALGDWLGPSEYWDTDTVTAAKTVLERVQVELAEHPPDGYAGVA